MSFLFLVAALLEQQTMDVTMAREAASTTRQTHNTSRPCPAGSELFLLFMNYFLDHIYLVSFKYKISLL